MWLSPSGDDNERERILDSKMSSTLLNSMLKASVSCDGDTVYSVTDLLKDCHDDFQGRISSCSDVETNLNTYGSGYIDHFSSTDTPVSCPISEHMLRTMFDKTFDVYGLEYNLEIDIVDIGQEYMISSLPGNAECDNAYSPAIQPFEMTRDTLELTLSICR
jgi:hypothetical protein